MSLKLYILMTMCLATLLFHTANGQADAGDAGEPENDKAKQQSPIVVGKSTATVGAVTTRDIGSSTDDKGISIGLGVTSAGTTGTGAGSTGLRGSTGASSSPGLKVSTGSSSADVVYARFSMLTLGALALGAFA